MQDHLSLSILLRWIALGIFLVLLFGISLVQRLEISQLTKGRSANLNWFQKMPSFIRMMSTTTSGILVVVFLVLLVLYVAAALDFFFQINVLGIKFKW